MLIKVTPEANEATEYSVISLPIENMDVILSSYSQSHDSPLRSLSPRLAGGRLGGGMDSMR